MTKKWFFKYVLFRRLLYLYNIVEFGNCSLKCPFKKFAFFILRIYNRPAFYNNNDFNFIRVILLHAEYLAIRSFGLIRLAA
jgi:hypothetical protein